MKHFSVPFLMSLVLVSNAGCSSTSTGDDDDAGTSGSPGAGMSGASGSSSGSGGTGGSGGGTGGVAPLCNGATVTASEVNNYKFMSTLTLPAIAVKPDSELTIEWAGITKDFMGHPLDPMTGVDTANVMLWRLNEQELQTKLNADDLSMREAEIPIKIDTMHMMTTANLFDFLTVANEPLSPEEILPFMSVTNYPPEENTYTAILAVGDLASGGDARMLQAFKLDPASTNTVVTLTNDSTKLTYTANMHELAPTMVPSGTAAITIDWTDMMLTALNTEFLPAQITEARIARYDETPTELESKFLDLELIDEETYETKVEAGTFISFDKFKNSSGAAFTGINSNGTWVIALICGSCRNPAPWYMTVLKPCN